MISNLNTANADCACYMTQAGYFPSPSGFCVNIFNDGDASCTYCVRHIVRLGYGPCNDSGDCADSIFYMNTDELTIPKGLSAESCIDIDTTGYECAQHWVDIVVKTGANCPSFIPANIECSYDSHCKEMD